MIPVPAISATMHIQAKLLATASALECGENPSIAPAIAPTAGLATISPIDTEAWCRYQKLGPNFTNCACLCSASVPADTPVRPWVSRTSESVFCRGTATNASKGMGRFLVRSATGFSVYGQPPDRDINYGP